MWSFIFIVVLGILLFNTILSNEKQNIDILNTGFTNSIVSQETNITKVDYESLEEMIAKIKEEQQSKSKKYESLEEMIEAIKKEEQETITIEETNQTLEENNQTFIDKMISLAKSKIGSPYIYANTGPDSFDCSGFVYYLFKEQNMSIARTSLAQSKGGQEINRTQIQRGDRVFFDTSNKGHVNHSGIYLGEDEFIHASSGRAKSVTISKMNGWYKDKFLWGIRTKRLEEDNLSNPLQDLPDHQSSKSSQDIP